MLLLSFMQQFKPLYSLPKNEERTGFTIFKSKVDLQTVLSQVFCIKHWARGLSMVTKYKLEMSFEIICYISGMGPDSMLDILT